MARRLTVAPAGVISLPEWGYRESLVNGRRHQSTRQAVAELAARTRLWSSAGEVTEFVIIIAAFESPALIACFDDGRRSSNAVVILASPKKLGHSPNARLVVTMVAEFVENNEIHPHQMLGKSALVPVRVIGRYDWPLNDPVR